MISSFQLSAPGNGLRWSPCRCDVLGTYSLETALGEETCAAVWICSPHLGLRVLAKLQLGLWTKAEFPGSHISEPLLQGSLEMISSYICCPCYLAGLVENKTVKVALKQARQIYHARAFSFIHLRLLAARKKGASFDAVCDDLESTETLIPNMQWHLQCNSV